MSITYLKRKILNFYINSWGLRTNRKIVVFESDDWGSIRMPSRIIYNKMLNHGYKLDNNQYQKYDSLASSDDLSALFDILITFSDYNGNHPVFTANTITSNPDFSRIRKSGFKEYYSELFISTLEKYYGDNSTFFLWQQGINSKIFSPQFHGREHFNVSRWMKSLQSGHMDTIRAFDNNIVDLGTSDIILDNNSYMDALRYRNDEEFDFVIKSLKEGLDQFESLFGYRSKSFVAPRYTWTPEIEKPLNESGIIFIKSRPYQSVPVSYDLNIYKNKILYTGKRNKYGQIYMVRNAYFEPSSYQSFDWIGKTLKSITTAFSHKKPAIICTHRVNYIGSIFEKNRKTNLIKLKELLRAILKKYPDVEFLTSDDLGAIMLDSKI